MTYDEKLAFRVRSGAVRAEVMVEIEIIEMEG